MYKDTESIIKGLIPWSRAEFQEINSTLDEQLKKPKDDWDVNPIYVPGIDYYHPINIVSTYMSRKYVDQDVFAANLLRYNKIIKFLRNYENDLIKEGLLNNKAGRHFIKDELIESLCVMPFSESKCSDNVEDKYSFSYGEVIENAWRLIKEKR